MTSVPPDPLRTTAGSRTVDPTDVGARWVVPFAAGDATMRDLLGGKGANLAEMARIGLPVPPGFIVTTEGCRAFRRAGSVPPGLLDQVDEALADLERATGRRLGDPAAPMLLSVRSGAPFSMPGMMDTVLDLGATDATVPGLVALGDEAFAWDATRRFTELFGRVVLGVEAEVFNAVLADGIAAAGVRDERDLTGAQLADIVARQRAAVEERGIAFPTDPREQLHLAVVAVFRSWDGARARAYRRVEGIDDDLGTAVNIQMMVFGNLDDRSATGVAFTRDPATGERLPYGDFLVGAQGEDVVAGTRHPEPLAGLADAFPAQHAELLAHLDTLERHYRDLCDIEFTIEAGKLWMLQTRVGKRSAAAALRMAVEMVDEGLITTDEALARVTPAQLEQLLHPRFGADAPAPATTGLAASPGAAVGRVVMTAEEAVAVSADGTPVVLVREETSPDDLEGMVASRGLLTSRGGLVSHAAVVARGLGIPAVCGASALRIDLRARTVTIDGTVVHAGDTISIDGSTGQVVVGEVELEVPDDDPRVDRLLAWADERRTLRIYANADTPDDARRALAAGAQGIGLCRTEHQFLGERLPLVQQVILARTPEEESAALAPLEQQQRADFEELLAVMDGRTVVVRLLDPPLHEFLPDVEELRIKEALGTLTDADVPLLEAASKLREHDPMLGIRGTRLGVLRPLLYEAQVRALLGAAAALRSRGLDPHVEIMVPLIATRGEVVWAMDLIRRVAAQLEQELGAPVPYTTATMIETPRAALRAAAIAPLVDAFSFGTNDLSQLTFGFSRDDVSANYIPAALAGGQLEHDPFRTLDRNGVVRLMDIAVTEGRAANPGLVTGICGEHGGDPDSIAMCHELGLTHVSCSASRVEVARLAAARAALGVAGPSASA
jgi:pyruvate,orthophosphate dikinase